MFKKQPSSDIAWKERKTHKLNMLVESLNVTKRVIKQKTDALQQKLIKQSM